VKRSDKQGLKAENQVIDRIGQLLERYQHRMALDDTRFAERYITSQIHVLIHFWVDGEEQVAPFSPCSESGSVKAEGFKKVAVLKERLGGPEPEIVHAHIGYQKGSVLIRDVEFVDNPKEIALPVLIRFGSVDRIYSILRHALYFSTVHGLVFRGAIEDRKTSLSENRLAVSQDKLASKMIESAAEIMNYISSNQTDTVRCRTEIMGRIKFLLSGVVVVLSNETVGLSVEKSISSDFQIGDMLFGPFDLLTNEGDFFISGEH